MFLSVTVVPLRLNCPCLCWLRDCVLSSMCPSLVRICPCDAHQWVNVGWRAPAFGFRGSPFTSCPCGLRPQGSLELFACFSTMKDILTYLTGVLWGIVNHSWQNTLGSSMEDALSRSLGFCPHWVVPRLELLSDLGKFSAPHPSSKLLVQMLTVFSWMLES